MVRVLVIYYTRTHNTENMAQLVAAGAREAGAEVALKEVSTVTVPELLEYDGIAVGSPTYYGSMATEIKRLLDDSVKLHGKLAGKVGAAFSSAANIGGGNETTIMGILQAFLIHGMIVQGNAKGDHYGVVSIGTPDARVKKQCHQLGQRLVQLIKKVCP